VPEFVSTIKVKDVKKVKKLFPETWTKYIIKVDSYETKQLLPSVVKEITPILDALKIDYELIEVPITLSGVCIAGSDYDVKGNHILVHTYTSQRDHKKKVEQVTKELAKHDLLEDVVCKVRIITEKIC